MRLFFRNSNSTDSTKESLVRSLSFILALALAIFLASNTLRNIYGTDVSMFKVSGNSMLPTLSNKQTLIINPPQGRIENGSIVVFLLPEAGYPFSAGNDTRHVVKRVIAGPGDTVEISVDDTVTVNGTVIDEPYLTEQAKRETYVPKQPTRYELAEDAYFVMGDNRINSCDSRYFGAVRYGEIIGVANEKTLDSSQLMPLLVGEGTEILILFLLTKILMTMILRKLFRV